MKRKLNSLKIDNFKNSLIENDIIFSFDINDLAKYFLCHYLNIDFFASTFYEIKEEFLENINFKNIKDTDYITEINNACSNYDKFYAYICRKYLNIIYSPKGIFDSEIDKIENKKKEFQNKINDIEVKINNIKTEEDYDNISFLKLKKSEFENYIKHLYNYSKKRIYNKCRELLYLKTNGYIDMNIETLFFSPYNDFTKHALANKLHDLPAGNYKKLVKEYEKNPKNIIKLMKYYIPEVSVIDKIKNRLDKNKQLNDKKELILSLLELYENKQYFMFITAAPSIIEGIFYDLCILFNIAPEELFGKGLSYKLGKLKDCFNSFELFYVYYFYNFRIIRNRVAHGKLLDNNIEWHYLLLDLLHVSQLLFKCEIPSNLKILLIVKIHESINNNCNKYLFDYMLKYIDLYDVKIDGFYKLDSEMKFIDDYINNKFLDIISDKVENIINDSYFDIKNNELIHVIYEIMPILLKNNNFYKNKCKCILSKIKFKKIDINYKLINSYFEDMIRKTELINYIKY